MLAPCLLGGEAWPGKTKKKEEHSSCRERNSTLCKLRGRGGTRACSRARVTGSTFQKGKRGKWTKTAGEQGEPLIKRKLRAQEGKEGKSFTRLSSRLRAITNKEVRTKTTRVSGTRGHRYSKK